MLRMEERPGGVEEKPRRERKDQSWERRERRWVIPPSYAHVSDAVLERSSALVSCRRHRLIASIAEKEIGISRRERRGRRGMIPPAVFSFDPDQRGSERRVGTALEGRGDRRGHGAPL